MFMYIKFQSLKHLLSNDAQYVAPEMNRSDSKPHKLPCNMNIHLVMSMCISEIPLSASGKIDEFPGKFLH